MAKRERGGTPATVVLEQAGVAFTLHPYRHDPRATSYGAEAAELLGAMGVEPARVFKTLMASVDDRLVVAMVPVAGQLDLKDLARVVGGSRAALADVARAQRATGYVAGGISAIGQRRSHPTVLDESAWNFATIYVSAGRRGLDLEIAPADLVRLTGAVVASIRRD